MNTKLTSKITNGIGWFTAWFLIFPTMVVYGILTILINKVTETKDNANTRGTSVESKIHPKNTKNTRNEFGFPTRDLL
ncbi:hypothetical protein CMO86_08390 [Candidatus Woesearchaeota archaeon]|jgi:hypothetical protein|nr:hypothetical protein [Candidatus Woesearchaeota archaeon]